MQSGVLVHLATSEEATQAQLARRVLVRPQSMSGVLDEMVERGLVSRGSQRSRGRRDPLALTAAGHDLLAVVWPAVRQAKRPDRLGMSEAEATALNAVLLRMVEGAARPGPPAEQRPAPGAWCAGGPPSAATVDDVTRRP